MKKWISLAMTAMMMMSLAACGRNTNATAGGSGVSAEESVAPTEVIVTCVDGTGEQVEVTVPYDPQRVVVVDFSALDILDNLDLGDRVVGAPNITLDYLQAYGENDNIANVGTVKTADLEAIMACEPDVIFMGGRMGESYDALSEIAPVVRLISDSSVGLVESVRKNAATIASIFGVEDKVDATMAEFDGRIAALSDFAAGKTALVGMCTTGSFNLLGNDGRCSIIGTEIGFDNIGVDAAASSSRGGGSSGSEGGSSPTHGNEASFELVVKLNPDYIFVMDRDAAIGTSGAQLAREVMENELVMSTDAYKNGNMIILEHPGVWYTGEGGITALGIMLEDLENSLL